LSLQDEETGDVTKSKNDYAVRTGLTGLPISQSNLTESIPVCHSKIRTFEWFIELIVRQNSHQKWSTTLKPLRYTDTEKDRYKEERNKLKKHLNDYLAINIGEPSDMVTGNSFKKFSKDHSRAILSGYISDPGKQSTK
jgi:hypothetical protein